MSTSKANQPTVPALDNYLPDDEDFFDPFASPTNSPNQSPKSKRKEPDGGLGIDEEISVAKRARVPRVKLDETRLLSSKGIPALRQRAGALKLKGKGHEFSDAARLLSFYQLWLDDLFPKAKFLDALAMVERAGHKTTMHKARTDWINDLKPNMMAPAEENRGDNAQMQSARIAPIFENRQRSGTQVVVGESIGVGDLFGGDELGDMYGKTPKATGNGGRMFANADGEPDDDDLEALMAETELLTRPTASVATSLFGEGRSIAKSRAPRHTNETPDDDDLDALMVEAELHTATGRPSANGGEQSQGDVVNDDSDLEALIAEAEGSVKLQPAAPSKMAQDKTSIFDEDEEAAMAELDMW